MTKEQADELLNAFEKECANRVIGVLVEEAVAKGIKATNLENGRRKIAQSLACYDQLRELRV